MHLEKATIERVIMSVEDYEAMPNDQLERVKNLERKLKQYTSMLHTFKKNYHKTPIYPGSHNDYGNPDTK